MIIMALALGQRNPLNYFALTLDQFVICLITGRNSILITYEQPIQIININVKITNGYRPTYTKSLNTYK